MSVEPYDMPSDEDLADVLQDYADSEPHSESDYPYRAALMRHAGSVVARLRAELERVTAERDAARAALRKVDAAIHEWVEALRTTRTTTEEHNDG